MEREKKVISEGGEGSRDGGGPEMDEGGGEGKEW